MHEKINEVYLSRFLGIKMLMLVFVCDLFLSAFGLNVLPGQILIGIIAISVLTKIFFFYFFGKEISNPLNLTNCFLLFFLFFSLGSLPLLLFSVKMNIPFKINPDSRYLALLYSNIFLAGYILSSAFVITLKKITRKNPTPISSVSSPHLAYLSPLVLTIAVIFSLTFFFSIKNVIQTSIQQGYMSIYSQTVSPVGFLVSFTAAFAIPSLLCFFLMTGPKLNTWTLLGLGLFLFVTISSYLTGVRSIAVFSSLGLCFTFRRALSKRNLNRISVIGFGFAAFFLVPISAYIRSFEGVNKYSFETLIRFFSDGNWSPLAVFKETSFTGDIFAKVIELSANKPYLLGASYFRSIYNVLPNRIADTVFLESPDFLANWFVRNVDPGWYDVGGGFAFNFIAEAYINFGITGILFLSLTTGILFSSVSCANSEKSESIWTELLEALLIVNVIIWVRSETLAIIRPVVWYSILPAMSVCIFESLVAIKNRSIAKTNFSIRKNNVQII